MPSLRPPKGYKRGFSDEACKAMAERCMRSELGQRALRERWGAGLYDYVMTWGSTPSKPETKAALHRAANEFLWGLIELRKMKNPSELMAANLRLLEARDAHEADLRRRFLNDDKGSDGDAQDAEA